MRRHWSTRLLSAFLALWFALSVGEPGVLHACPMHGGGAGGMMMDGAGHAGMMMGGMGHGTAHATRHQSPSPAPRDQHHHCTCIGCCVGTGAAALVAAGPTVALTVATLEAVTAPLGAAQLPRRAPPHSLPLQTGPPRI